MIGPLQRLAILAGLWAVVVVQPVLSAMGKAPELFIFYGTESTDVTLFLAALVIVPPLVLWLVVSGLSQVDLRAGRWGFAILVATLAAGLVMQVGRSLDIGRPIVLAPAALVGGIAAAAAVDRMTGIRQWVTVLAPAGLVFAALFWLTAPPVRAVRAADGSVEPIVAAGSSADPVPIAILVLDELPLRSIVRADFSLDRELVPNLTEFATDATWYRGHTTVADHTTRAVPALVTGRYVRDTRGEGLWFDHPDNLFRLAASTHELHVDEAITQLCPPSLCPLTSPNGAGSGADPPAWRRLLSDARQVASQQLWPWREPGPIGLDRFTETQDGAPTFTGSGAVDVMDPLTRYFGMTAPTQPGRFTDFLAGMAPRGERPPFYFLHLVLPHQPWRFRADGTDRGEIDPAFIGLHDGSWEEAPYQVAVARDRHLDQTAYTDQLVGAFLDRLKDLDLYDDAVIAIVADHGISFLPGTRDRAVEDRTAAEILPTPLFVKSRGTGDGGITDEHLQIVDVLGMVGAAAGLDVPWTHDGVPPGERGGQLAYLGEESGMHATNAGDLLDEVRARAKDPESPERVLGDAGLLGHVGEGPTGAPIVEIAGPLGDYVTATVDPQVSAVGLAVDGVVVAAAMVAEEGRVVFAVPPGARGASVGSVHILG